MASENSIKLKQIPEKYKGKTIYSFSRLGTYKECPHQYYLTYINRQKAFIGCDNLTTINVPWSEGAVENAPWGATNATINYNYVAG